MRFSLTLGVLAILTSVACVAETDDNDSSEADLSTPTPTTAGITAQPMSGTHAQVQYDVLGRAQVLHRGWKEATSRYGSTVAVRWSIRKGSTWSTETLDASGPAVFAIDAQGAPHVTVIGGTSDRTSVVTYTRSESGTWTAEAIETGSHIEGGPAQKIGMSNPGTAFDSTGALHVAYERSHTVPSLGSDLIHAWKSGATWQTEVVAPIAMSGTSNAQMVIAKDGTVHVSYLANAVRMHASGRAGGAWTTEVLPPVVSTALLDRTGKFVLAGCDASGVAGLWTKKGSAYARETIPLTLPASDKGCEIGAAYDSSGRPHVVVTRLGRLEYAVKEKNVWKSYRAADLQTDSSPSPALAVRSRGGFQVGIAHSESNQLMFSTLAF